MGIGTVAVIGTFGMGTFGWTCRDVVETRGDDVSSEHPFAAALLTRQRIMLQLRERAADRAAMRVGQRGVSTRERLNADGLGCVKGRVPPCPPFGSSVGVADENLGGVRPLAAKNRSKIFGSDFTGEPQRVGALAEPLTSDSMLFGVVVVLGVLLFVVDLGLTGTERTSRHDQHGSSPQSARRAWRSRDAASRRHKDRR